MNDTAFKIMQFAFTTMFKKDKKSKSCYVTVFLNLNQRIEKSHLHRKNKKVVTYKLNGNFESDDSIN